MKKSPLSFTAWMSIAASFLTAFAFVSCSDDLAGYFHSGNNMRFTLSESNWSNAGKTRSAEASGGQEYNTAVLALCDRSNKDSLYLHVYCSDEIDEKHFASDGNTTRGVQVGTDSFYDSFGVMTSVYTGEWKEDACYPDYMYNEEVTKESKWTTNYFWPGAKQNVRFFAYAPYNADGLTLTDKSKAGTPSFTYSVPAKVEDQKDLLATATEAMTGETRDAAPLNFYHPLTAVRFAAGDKMLPGKVTAIRIKNVYGKATHTFGADKWTDYEGKTDYALELDADISGTSEQLITKDNQTFMMIPQQLPEGATIEVDFTDALTQTPRKLTASIAGSTWPMGKTITYKISTTSIVVEPVFDVNIKDFTYKGGSTGNTVSSYIKVTRVGDPTKIVNSKWTAEFVKENGAGGYDVITRPSWITSFNTSGNGGENETFNATAEPRQYRVIDPHNDALRAATPVSGVYDLSTKGGKTKMNTANCYVINAPGTYKLPCVYGNAIKNGATNKSAFTSTKSGSRWLSQFVKYDDTAITDPWIDRANAYGNEQKCEIVWQDVEGLLSDLQLTGSKQDGFYLQFKINQSKMHQGNALIAITDNHKGNPTILWSWHIWVTDYQLGENDKVITNNNNVKYTVMPVNIGWCDGVTWQYDQRDVKVRFTQEGTGATKLVDLKQLAHTYVIPGNCTYYQWGRKDPILPIDYTSGKPVNKKYYSDKYQGELEKKTWTSKITIGESIQKPYHYYYAGTADWCKNTYYNLWSANIGGIFESDENVVKTVYDPSPVGYCMPANSAFTGFKFDDTYGERDFSKYNTPYKSGDEYDKKHGWEFYCNRMPAVGRHDTSGGTVFFPACGYRWYSKFYVPEDIGKMGSYWFAGLGKNKYITAPESNAGSFNFLKDYIATYDIGTRSDGKAVRPVREK